MNLAAQRPVVQMGGQWLTVDEDRFPFAPGEVAQMRQVRQVRLCTLDCQSLAAVIKSEATTLAAVIAEALAARSAERQGRLIDSDTPGSMEKKKQEGYF